MNIGYSTGGNGSSFVARPYEPLPGLHRRPTFAEIDFAAMRSNLQLVRQLAKGARIMASVKAQAYGHGLLRVAEFLAREGIDAFGAGFLEEAVWLREAGITQPILALGGIAHDQIAHYLDYDIALACASLDIAKAISGTATRLGKCAKVHLKIDTGMRRLGVYYENAAVFATEVARLPGIEIEGILSHFATADSPDDLFAHLQLERFLDVIEQLRRNGIEPPLKHIASSSALLNLPESRLDMVRLGLLLYGYRPTLAYDARLTGLQPAMTFKTSVLFVKGVRANEGISYGLTYRTPRDCWLATLPVGYGDGYNRALSNRAHVLIYGRRYPVVGRICMDQIMVDLGRDRVETGTEVVLFGRQRQPDGDVLLDGWELCRLLDTTPYELTCWVAERVPRVYIYPEQREVVAQE